MKFKTDTTFLYKELSLSHLSDMNFFSTCFLTPKLRRHIVSRILVTFLEDITLGRVRVGWSMEDESFYILLHLVFVLTTNVCKNCILFVFHRIENCFVVTVRESEYKLNSFVAKQKQTDKSEQH